MEKIRKNTGENIIDFIINYNGSIENDLIDFMLEQGYDELSDFNSADKYILTDILSTKTANIASKTDDTFDMPERAFNTSFSIAFDA